MLMIGLPAAWATDKAGIGRTVNNVLSLVCIEKHVYY